MAGIISFTFNPFYENTYVVYDRTGRCVIIDPGCYDQAEEEELADTIRRKALTPVLLLNTHCHVDHVLGNKFVADTWKIPLVMHKGELPVLENVVNYAPSLGIYYKPSPQPTRFVEEGDTVEFGETKLKVFYTPGHSPASVCFYAEKDGFIVSGDVLFHNSVGRTDLPGGDPRTLFKSITEKLLTLPDATKVYAGHMQATTIGAERDHNPFLQVRVEDW